jgi:hypothetical protein
MRTRLHQSRIRLAGAVVALAVLLGLAATLASGAPRAHQARAAVVITHRNPLTLRGTGFKPHAHVRVTLIQAHKLVHRPLTNARGTFTTTFSVVIDRCSGWTLTASQPGRATVLLHGAKPECPPA